MARRSTASTFSRIIYGAVVLLFSLIALAVTYQAFTQGINLRSKAAQTDVIYKGWEFNGKDVNDTDGWNGGLQRLIVSGGALQMTVRRTSKVPFISQNSMKTSLPQGNKYLKISMNVSGPSPKSFTPQSQVYAMTLPLAHSTPSTNKDDEFDQTINQNMVCTQDVKICADGSFVGRIGPQCFFAPCPAVDTTAPPIPQVSLPMKRRAFSALVYYKLKNKRLWEKPIAFDGTFEQGFRQYLVRFPEIAATTIDRLRIAFPSGIMPGDQVNIDWIRLVGMKEIPPPPPPTGTPYTCGGIQGAACPSGYVCLMEANYPDAGGKCVPSGSKVPTPSPICTPLPSCAYGNEKDKYGNSVFCAIPVLPVGYQYCPRTSPTLTPTPSAIYCKYGVNEFIPYDSCGTETGLWRHARYSCYGPTQGVLGSGNECVTSSAWNKQAIAACGYSSNCDIRPTPTPSYYTTPYPSSYPSPTPYYPSPTYYPSTFPSYSPVTTY